ncbi:MAG: heavy metal-binding domain-containing protein, partial [Bdellovibrionales bacterium]|nr:heavy metal-binding domain-containing protein [Bdellovibrionales bacterium]
GWVVGRAREARHFQSLAAREAATGHLPASQFRTGAMIPKAGEVLLVSGSVVVSIDYFKLVAGSLKSIFGGRVTAYETLLERARREAVLRMKEQALAWNATEILNVRIDTSSIGGGLQGGIVSVESIAYGTAIRQT